MTKRILPELLAPAGSPLAFDAAIEGGADAIYVGGSAFNARINAKNFTPDELREAIARAHAYGVKVYLAANTLIYDRELEAYLRAAEEAYLSGADAIIVADMGAAREIKKRIPIELHASTQISGHNVDAAKLLAEAGFSRMVCAREMSRDDLAYFCKNSPIESEVFVHGALCVCHSGQCLFSSLVGQRSGNRGECAQPCRLPYKNGKKDVYPLSLKDLSLATHVRELCDMGVSSFKIEGRMKSPEYVRDVIRIWRRLLDERRDATPAEMDELAKIFSRGGFTDGYYTKKIDRSMLGVRSEADKKESGSLVPFSKIERKIPISLCASIRSGEPMKLTAKLGEREACVMGEIPQAAINAPLSRETVERNLSKLGATAYSLEKIEIELDEGLMVPISALNALRRAAVEALAPTNERKESDMESCSLDRPKAKRDRSKISRTATFFDPTAIPDGAEDFFERIYIPLEEYAAYGQTGYGVMLPEIVYDSERAEVEKMLLCAKEAGATYALVQNLGQVDLVRGMGFRMCADFRLNASNNVSVAELEALGFCESLLSPELSLAQQRDIGGASRAIVYGRMPLMITEKCVGRETGGCDACNSGKTVLTDRRGVEFPVRRRWKHRSVIFNSLPIYMGDRAEILRANGLSMQHFIFTTESKSEVKMILSCAQEGKSFTFGECRRIK